jgi:hypothetical protein
MKVYKIKGVEYSLRNKSKEVTLNEFAKISHILSDDEKDVTDRWLEVLTILSSKELVNQLTLNQFTSAIQSCNLMDVKGKVTKRIEVAGRSYECDVVKGQIQLNARDLSAIEKLAKAGESFGAKVFALVYKDTQLTNEEHYTPAHIQHKSKLFGDIVMADVAAPAIIQVGTIIMEHFNKMINASSPSVPSAE